MKDITELRLELLNNGYTPIAKQDKICTLKNWPNLIVDENVIEKQWHKMSRLRTTAIRIENGLCAIDMDIDHRIIGEVQDAMLSILPESLRPERLTRMGGGHKQAWFCRTDSLFSRIHSRKWVAPGESVDDGTHCIEIFGGGESRQFGCFGPHTTDEDGNVKVAYRWENESLRDVAAHELDLITKDQLFLMVDAAEEELKLQGFTPVKKTKKGENTKQKIYDLTYDMTFDTQDDGSVSLSDLENMVAKGYQGRCSASWHSPGAKNRTRCLISSNSAGHVTIWDSAEGTTHLPERIKPSEIQAKLTDRVVEILRREQDKKFFSIDDNDDHVLVSKKLLQTYGYMPTNEKTPIISLWDNKKYSVRNFRTLMMPYCGEVITETETISRNKTKDPVTKTRKVKKKVNPIDLWLSDPARLVLDGERMRPDMPRPTFEENDGVWVNTYAPINLGSAKNGTPEGGVKLLEQLLPIESERTWFIQWLAHKWKNPHIPSLAVIMVARQYGTGRGTLGTLIKLLFGERYVVNVKFNTFAGLNYQSQYDDWGLDALFAIVNESSTSGDKSLYKVKHEVYEHLKEIVDPAPTERTYIRKYERHARATASTSYLIMTNNPDALPLPENDRRFVVLENGDTKDNEFWNYIRDWMSLQNNIAAFAKYLEDVDISNFNAYEPINTHSKSDMTLVNKTPIDHFIEEALDSIEGYFVEEQIVKKVSDQATDSQTDLPDAWKSIVTHEVRRKTFIVRYANGRTAKPQINGRRYTVLSKDNICARNFIGGGIKGALLRNGDVFNESKNIMREKLKIVK